VDAARAGWDPEDYARNSAAQRAWAEELIPRLALLGEEALLDIGCGDGRVTAELARQLPRGSVLGIDSSDAMVARARDSYPPERHPNLAFAVMDAADLHPGRTFDVAFSNAALHWVPDQQAVLRGVRACLRTGGRLLFQMGGQGNADAVFAALREVLVRQAWAGRFEGFASPYRFPGTEEYRRWLLEAGLRPRRVELLARQMRHGSRAELAGWLRTTWFPYTDRLPGERRAAFLEEVLDAYLASHPPGPGGETRVDMVRLEVEADG